MTDDGYVRSHAFDEITHRLRQLEVDKASRASVETLELRILRLEERLEELRALLTRRLSP